MPAVKQTNVHARQDKHMQHYQNNRTDQRQPHDTAKELRLKKHPCTTFTAGMASNTRRLSLLLLMRAIHPPEDGAGATLQARTGSLSATPCLSLPLSLSLFPSFFLSVFDSVHRRERTLLQPCCGSTYSSQPALKNWNNFIPAAVHEHAPDGKEVAIASVPAHNLLSPRSRTGAPDSDPGMLVPQGPKC